MYKLFFADGGFEHSEQSPSHVQPQFTEQQECVDIEQLSFQDEGYEVEVEPIEQFLFSSHEEHHVLENSSISSDEECASQFDNDPDWDVGQEKDSSCSSLSCSLNNYIESNISIGSDEMPVLLTAVNNTDKSSSVGKAKKVKKPAISFHGILGVSHGTDCNEVLVLPAVVQQHADKFKRMKNLREAKTLKNLTHRGEPAIIINGVLGGLLTGTAMEKVYDFTSSTVKNTVVPAADGQPVLETGGQLVSICDGQPSMMCE